MFNKLLSNLPFNPSLINQVAFYSKRLKQEASVRRLGFVLVALTMILQLSAVFSPAQPSLAADTNNDILAGGVTSKEQLVLYCLNNKQDFQTILSHFAISCNNVQNNSAVTTIHSTDLREGQPLYSMGRIARGQVNSKTGRMTDEVTVDINGHPYFMRLLHSWDSHNSSTYTALSVGNAFGVQFFILFSCGNIVQWGKPVPPPPAPTPKPKPTPKPTPQPTKPCDESKDVKDIKSCIIQSKTAANTTQQVPDANNTTANAGDVITYTLMTKNTAKVVADGYIVQENLNDVLEFANLIDDGGSTVDSGVLTWPANDIAPGATLSKQIEVKVKDPIPSTPQPCNPAVVKPCPDSSSFDLVMTNFYGNEININLKPTVAKKVEITTTKTLTNTGPGTSLIIGFSLTALVGYFFARSRMMAAELDLVRTDYTSGGF